MTQYEWFKVIVKFIYYLGAVTVSTWIATLLILPWQHKVEIRTSYLNGITGGYFQYDYYYPNRALLVVLLSAVIITVTYNSVVPWLEKKWLEYCTVWPDQKRIATEKARRKEDE